MKFDNIPVFQEYQEIHSESAMYVDSVKINISLMMMMRECTFYNVVQGCAQHIKCTLHCTAIHSYVRGSVWDTRGVGFTIDWNKTQWLWWGSGRSWVMMRTKIMMIVSINKQKNYDGQVLRKMWYFMLAVVQDKNLKHTKQLWFRYPLCIYLCVFKLGIKFKDFSQMSHDKGFTFYNLKQL